MPKLLPRSHLAQSFVSTFLGPKTQKCLPRGAKTTKFSHLRMHQRQTDQCELITRRSQEDLLARWYLLGYKKPTRTRPNKSWWWSLSELALSFKIVNMGRNYQNNLNHKKNEFKEIGKSWSIIWICDRQWYLDNCQSFHIVRILKMKNRILFLSYIIQFRFLRNSFQETLLANVACGK